MEEHLGKSFLLCICDFVSLFVIHCSHDLSLFAACIVHLLLSCLKEKMLEHAHNVARCDQPIYKIHHLVVLLVIHSTRLVVIIRALNLLVLDNNFISEALGERLLLVALAKEEGRAP